jgi:hypothetical protein
METEYEWPYEEEVNQEPLLYKTNEERNSYIKNVSGDCWWLKTYLDNTLPQINY